MRAVGTMLLLSIATGIGACGDDTTSPTRRNVSAYDPAKDVNYLRSVLPAPGVANMQEPVTHPAGNAAISPMHVRPPGDGPPEPHPRRSR